jgi:LysR family transcriptional regulator, low CO2-responsive transcriptional regulator
MTLAQLQSFVLVARLGSVKAAAAELGVTEPAVSVAVSALRRELGDELFVRDGRGIALTAGGRRLAALAAEILGLAEQARRSVADSPGQARQMQVAVTGIVVEHIGPLIDAFSTRDPELEVTVETAPAAGLAEMLEHRHADIVLGPPPPPERAATIASVPFLRSRLVVLAAPGHRLAGHRSLGPADLKGERWLVGPPGVEPATGAGLLFTRIGLTPKDVVSYTSHAAAIAAATAGDGVVVAMTGFVASELRRGALIRLDVPGTPLPEMWHASTLGFGRALPAALALQRFATSPEAMHALSTGRAGAASARARPRPHVTLWSSVVAGARPAAGQDRG